MDDSVSGLLSEQPQNGEDPPPEPFETLWEIKMQESIPLLDRQFLASPQISKRSALAPI
jgi:hypothetical protein